MCATVLWAVNQAGCTPRFREWTKSRLGVDPEPSRRHLEVPELVGKTARLFTLPLQVCDCSSAVGHGRGKPDPGGPGVGDHVDWLHGLPGHSRFTSRVAVVRTWNPEETIFPAGTTRVDSAEPTDEKILLLPEENPLAIDFPAPVDWWS
ncbi:hypothetical protein DQ353_15550 [Arthrobacter sp. AQ5-05]|uniref:hypothetical protein n=1 Tax=Arthrobacter sp. AQ5-05 TaxID=2184581 RepID=UPI000DCE029D|nr:hypothetical protein [Arthrobacter sp. AQ5-05]RAX48338.1 hypothetical protein DQ353_15550 [Arthrobacter sp. AQ5-05]